MKIDFSQNTLIITLYDKENIYHIWNTNILLTEE